MDFAFDLRLEDNSKEVETIRKALAAGKPCTMKIVIEGKLVQKGEQAEMHDLETTVTYQIVNSQQIDDVLEGILAKENLH